MPTPRKHSKRLREYRKQIETLENEIWQVEEDAGASDEYAIRGLILADLRERQWGLRASVARLEADRHDPGTKVRNAFLREEENATKLALKAGEQRARMSDKARNDLLPRVLRKLDERDEQAARLRKLR